jgi:hypothetical protein
VEIDPHPTVSPHARDRTYAEAGHRLEPYRPGDTADAMAGVRGMVPHEAEHLLRLTKMAIPMWRDEHTYDDRRINAVRLQIWNAREPRDATRWRAVHRAWSGREVFAHPSYVSLFAGQDDEPLAAFAETGSGFILYPFILRPLTAPHLRSGAASRFDIVSPYGYGGAFHSMATDVDAKEFWSAFDDFCRAHRIVSEFTRLSLFDSQRLAHPGTTQQRLVNVVRDLRAPAEEIWRDVDHKVRKNVNKARRSRVEIDVDENGDRLGDFLRIYEKTMDRRKASAGYYFPRAFFETLISDLPGLFVFFHAVRGSQVVSTELVLVSADNIYSYLGGTEEDAFALRPNDLLKFEAFRWGQTRGKSRMVLGGGHATDDGIFRYKRSFAPHGLVPYSVGMRVHDEDAYGQLVEAHRVEGRRRNPAWETAGFFPAYRQELPA